MRDSAGVRIVTNAAPRWDPGEGWVVRSDPRLEIGRGDGDAEPSLHRVSAALRLADGTIVVANAGSSELLIFEGTGRFLRSFGREGEGPGEFVRLAGIALLEDTLLAFDASLGRLSLFSLPNGYVRSIRLEPTGDPVRPLRLYRLRGVLGRDLVLVPYGYPANMRPQPTVYWDSLPNLLYGMDGTLRDTIGSFSGMEMFATPRRSTNLPFGRISAAAVGEVLFYIGRAADYEIRTFGPDGDLRAIIRKDQEPTPLTSELRQTMFEERLYGVPADDPRRQEARRFLESIPLPQLLPAHGPALVVDRLGHLWVQDYRPRFDPSPDTWSVLDPSGHWLGRVRLPDGFRVFEIGRDYVLGLWRGELDVEHVVLHELDRSQ